MLKSEEASDSSHHDNDHYPKRQRSDSSLLAPSSFNSSSAFGDLRRESTEIESKQYEKLLHEFQSFRNLDSFTDLTIKSSLSEFQTLRAHACFIAAHSPKLASQLGHQRRKVQDDTATCQEYFLEIEDVPFFTLKKIIHYIYTNNITVKTKKELTDVQLAAKKMEISIPNLVLTQGNRLICTNTLIGHTAYVCALAFTKNGLLVSGARDNSIRVWDPKSSIPRVELNNVHSDRVWALITIPTEGGGEKLLSGSWDSTIIVWNSETWQKEKTLEGHEDWVTCLVQVGKKYLVSGSADSTLRVWTCQKYEPERVLRGHVGHIYALCVNPTAELLFSAGSDGLIYVWDTKHWRILQKNKGHTPDYIIRALCWCNVKNCLMSGASDGKIRIWSINSTPANVTPKQTELNLEFDIDAHSDWVECLIEMSKGRIASGSRDCIVKIWNAQENFECLQSIRKHSHWVYALLFENELLVSASCDMKIKIWKEEEEEIEETAMVVME